MGGKGSKGLDKKLCQADFRKLSEGMSREDLAGYLSSISDMAHTGTCANVPEIRVNDRPPDVTLPVGCSVVTKSDLRDKLRRQLSNSKDESVSQELSRQLELLEDLDGAEQDDTSDWASMRSWLVWCLQNKLQDDFTDDVDSKILSLSGYKDHRGGLARQMSLDHTRLRLTHQGSASFDSERSGPMSGQSSFDSTGPYGDT